MRTALGARGWFRVGGVLLVATTLSVACGDDDDDGPTSQGSGGEATSGGSDGHGQAGVDGDSGGQPPTGDAGANGIAGSGATIGGAAGDTSTGVGAAGNGGAGGAAGAGGGGPDSLFDCSPLEGDQEPLKLTELSKALSLPIAIAQPLGETERLFVAELKGTIRILKNGQLTPTPFLDLSDKLQFSDPERGLVALAFHPNYAKNGRFFVVYTKEPTMGGSIQLSEFHRVDAEHAAPTETPLLEVAQPKPNHIGRALAFGPDGNLYWALGDGGGSTDETLVGQLATGLLGKIVRIDVDSAPEAPKAYAIPVGNMPGGAPERWAFGLRFPLGLSFDACTGDMFVGDSYTATNEINFAPAQQGGQNYGWSMYAGSECFKPTCTPVAKWFPTYLAPSAFQLHGGFVYRGSALKSFRGHYFAVDRTEQVAIAFELVGDAPVLRNLSLDLGANLVGTQGIGQDSRGELYLANRSGAVYRIDRE